MPKYSMDFDLDSWITNLEIEADSREEAKKKLCSMSIEEIIKEGYVKDFNIMDLDIEELEEE